MDFGGRIYAIHKISAEQCTDYGAMRGDLR